MDHAQTARPVEVELDVAVLPDRRPSLPSRLPAGRFWWAEDRFYFRRAQPRSHRPKRPRRDELLERHQHRHPRELRRPPGKCDYWFTRYTANLT